MSIEAKIKRNKLDVLAGEFYQNADSNFIKHLQQKGFEAIVDIKRQDGIYTVIGKDFTYFYSNSGIEDQISHKDFLEVLKKNAMKIGKANDFEFVKYKEDCSIWVLNGETMNAIWNTVMLLHK
ncbi:hypothetical protein [Flavobacterium sp. ENC]|uniref:hypothetical protein n=1 Tax=Flavobacterium sp. ENC TaxID=2897330 RepID=UPI001E2A9AC9|nr:hypothetical protein [Flavobacterium sp. ENC]MCD0464947.1 hypothetical protein [Flavobacterium sp. ENC]